MSRAIPLLSFWAFGVCYRANFTLLTFDVYLFLFVLEPPSENSIAVNNNNNNNNNNLLPIDYHLLVLLRDAFCWPRI
jgi:hypothetical protein